MQLLAPAFLWLAFFLLPAILLLYLLKREYKDITVSSTWLWREMLEQIEANRPWQKLWFHLLLLLQLLAAVFFIFGLSRPSLPVQGLTAKHSILVIDISGSMRTEEQKKSRIEIAKERAIEWVENKNQDQTVTLIAMGKTPKVMISQSRDQDAIIQKIEQLAAQISPSDLSTALSLAHAISVKESSSEVILISDGAYSSTSTSIRPHRFIQVGKAKQNLAVGSVTPLIKGNRQGLFVRIDNTDNKKNQAIVSVRNEQGTLLDTQSISVAGKKSHVLRFADLPKALYYQVNLRSEQDALKGDNKRYSPVQSKNRIQIKWMGKENLFLQKALKLQQGVQIEQVDRLNPKQSSPLTVLNRSDQPMPKTGPVLIIRPHQAQKLLKITGKTAISGQVKVNRKHPLLGKLPLKQLSIAEVSQIKVPAWAEVVLEVNEVPILLAGEYQGRRVVIFLFDLQKSDFVLQPSFPIVITQVVKWLIPTLGVQGSQVEVGEPIHLNLSTAIQKVRIENRTHRWEKKVKKGSFRWRIPERIGLYRISDQRTKQTVSYLTVPFPQEESTIAPQKIPTTPLSDTAATTPATKELWWWLALSTSLIICVEWMVVIRGY